MLRYDDDMTYCCRYDTRVNYGRRYFTMLRGALLRCLYARVMKRTLQDMRRALQMLLRYESGMLQYVIRAVADIMRTTR